MMKRSPLCLCVGLFAATFLGRTVFATEAESRSLAKNVPEQRRSTDRIPIGDISERMIGELTWHTDYAAAYEEARQGKKMLFIFFRDESRPHIADSYERDVLSQSQLRDRLTGVVRVVLPLDVATPGKPLENDVARLLDHAAFAFMYKRQGIAMLDLTDKHSPHFGQVVSAHPFSQGRYYTVRGTELVLGLPRGTITQRTLIWAVREHAAGPLSTTGKCHDALLQQANRHSQLQAQYESVGHHDWGTRYNEVAAATGMSASEVAASSWGAQTLVEAAQQIVQSWAGSGAHWGMVANPQANYGYDMVKAASGTWYGTGIFAN
jgi:hypothetical protein